ncbi:ribulose-phosphate 3-epimerase [Flavihumibacter sp. CACIAM 22H1]|uniref:ribulose-phosphate 3-epimerase n=1 Tax=Flavihumibacter sp. CACIAM 22H1 TaxID=1812911 RepID=UPI0007A92F21|nr:ribulose-phosphate 3-epimerase [Flavihumibacter sp. CACIAM 22H1]KYP14722.1 MAG: ribulose-phosphate 3-epimerase [Flavihumibacter sp. CACIAM 22H1]
MIIAPSLLASNFLHLEAEAQMLNESEADWFHLDVMDGRFVNNISFGLPVIQQIRKTTKKILDVHLMIEEPEKYAEAFAKAGADILTVHYEACRHLHRNIQQIRELGMVPGVAINPHTPVQLLQDILQDVDLVLIMSVNPGFGGQRFIPHTYQKIKTLRNRIDQLGLQVKIEVDGGVDLSNAKALGEAGADVLVAGTAVFHAPAPKEVISSLKHCTD